MRTMVSALALLLTAVTTVQAEMPPPGHYSGLAQRMVDSEPMRFSAELFPLFVVIKKSGEALVDDLSRKPVPLQWDGKQWGTTLGTISVRMSPTVVGSVNVIDILTLRKQKVVRGVRVFLAQVSAEKFQQQYAKARRRARITLTAALLRQIGVALSRYEQDYGLYPKSGNKNLVTMLDGNPDNGGPQQAYFKFGKTLDTNGRLIDSWGNPINYSFDAEKYRWHIWSNGPDGKNDNGKKDDIPLEKQ